MIATTGKVIDYRPNTNHARADDFDCIDRRHIAAGLATGILDRPHTSAVVSSAWDGVPTAGVRIFRVIGAVGRGCIRGRDAKDLKYRIGERRREHQLLVPLRGGAPHNRVLVDATYHYAVSARYAGYVVAFLRNEVFHIKLAWSWCAHGSEAVCRGSDVIPARLRCVVGGPVAGDGHPEVRVNTTSRGQRWVREGALLAGGQVYEAVSCVPNKIDRYVRGRGVAGVTNACPNHVDIRPVGDSIAVETDHVPGNRGDGECGCLGSGTDYISGQERRWIYQGSARQLSYRDEGYYDGNSSGEKDACQPPVCH